MSALVACRAPTPRLVQPKQVIDAYKPNTTSAQPPARTRLASAVAPLGALPAHRSDSERATRSSRAFTWG